jgi:hypothetical protein
MLDESTKIALYVLGGFFILFCSLVVWVYALIKKSDRLDDEANARGLAAKK